MGLLKKTNKQGRCLYESVGIFGARLVKDAPIEKKKKFKRKLKTVSGLFYNVYKSSRRFFHLPQWDLNLKFFEDNTQSKGTGVILLI